MRYKSYQRDLRRTPSFVVENKTMVTIRKSGEVVEHYVKYVEYVLNNQENCRNSYNRRDYGMRTRETRGGGNGVIITDQEERTKNTQGFRVPHACSGKKRTPTNV